MTDTTLAEDYPADRLLTWRQACQLLGVSRPTLWRWQDAGVVPKPIQIGGVPRFREAELRAVIERAAAERDKEVA